MWEIHTYKVYGKVKDSKLTNCPEKVRLEEHTVSPGDYISKGETRTH
jgi:hypothetical protein